MASEVNQKKLLSIVKNLRLDKDARELTLRSIHQYMLTDSSRIRGENFKEICSSDLGLLFQITDEHFFDGLVGQVCERTADRPLSFRLSTRMTTSGGMTTMQTSRDRKNPATEYEIAIATTPLFATFGDDARRSVVSGRVCENRLEALQRIMEHEMVHLIEMLLWKDSNCAANPFKNIVRRFFGHTESNHQLLTPKDLARKRLGISTGDLVTFTIEGTQYTGYVNRITKRATILVEDPQGIAYSDGLKYSKFYVPLNRLKRA